MSTTYTYAGNELIVAVEVGKGTPHSLTLGSKLQLESSFGFFGFETVIVSETVGSLVRLWRATGTRIGPRILEVLISKAC